MSENNTKRSDSNDNSTSNKKSDSSPKPDTSVVEKTKWIVSGAVGLFILALIAAGAFSTYLYFSKTLTDDKSGEKEKTNNSSTTSEQKDSGQQKNNQKESSKNQEQNSSNNQQQNQQSKNDGQKQGGGSSQQENAQQGKESSPKNEQQGEQQEKNDQVSPEKRIDQAVNSLEISEGMEVRSIVLKKVKQAVDRVEADLRKVALKSVANVIDTTTKKEISEDEIVDATQETMTEVELVLTEVRSALAKVAEVPAGQARAKEQKWKQGQALRDSTK